jgi:hypothetical protein
VVTRVYTLDRTDVLAGKPFGKSGPYERIVAKAHFAVDPKLPQNSTIRDLNLAPRNAAGLVEFSADVYVLKPRDPAKGNGTVLFEVSNRGGKGLLGRFNLGSGSAAFESAEAFGDGLLLEEGYTLVWVGWQWDAPRRAGLLRLDAPIATQDGKPIRGIVRSELVPDAPVTTMGLADRDHAAYAAVTGEPATLTVKDSESSRRTTIPASQWKFNNDRTAIEMASGFQPGRIYALTYTAENPVVAGLGMAAVRDFIAYLKYGGDGLSVLSDQRRFIKRALGFGVSQSGRWLRTFLYFGMNEDEKGRKVFDGVWADVAGGGRGSFNHRFAQPSRTGYTHTDAEYPTDLFPFTDVPQTDASTGESESLLLRVRDAVMPKIFYTNTSLEYWGRCAALIHTSPDGALDAPLPPQTRLYVASAAQHGPNGQSARPDTAQFPTPPNDFRPMHRALLTALHEWVRDGKTPPESQYPLVAEKQLVPLSELKFPRIPGVAVPQFPKRAYPLDFGPQFKDMGIISKDPPRAGRPYALLVPQVDADGMDIAGIRMPVMRVPLGTAVGWNFRSQSAGASQQLARLTGSWFPLAATKLQRESSKDPRPSIEERYASRDEYLKRVRQAADDLVARRLLLSRDVDFVLNQAGRLWDASASQH